jgi:uncharacterized protein YecA (UPF0149 family)
MSNVKQKSVSLSDMLSNLTKDELHFIRRILQVHGGSQLNKSDLVEFLSSHLLEGLHGHLERFDQERYRIIKQVMKAPGALLPISKLKDAESYDAAYFQTYGLLFQVGDKVIMPQDIRGGMLKVSEKLLTEVFKRNMEWIQLTKGLLFYYGSMDMGKLADLIEQYSGKPVDVTDYILVIGDLEMYDYSVKMSRHQFSHYMVDDPDRIRMEHESRPTIEYYPLTKAQVLNAAEDDYVERHEGYKQLMSFLRVNWDMSEQEADEMISELVDQIRQNASLTDLVSILQEQLDFENMDLVQRLVDMVVILYNKTRVWELKGYSPEELRVQSTRPQPQPQQANSSGMVYDFQTKMKVGRNDPCPCGSGKKFKKCCGG